MSAYARQSSIAFRSPAADQSSNRRDGIHRFSQRHVSIGRYNDKVNARYAVDNRNKARDDSAACNFEETAPIEGSINASNADEYPFSQITMSQCSAGESSFFSLRSSGVAAAAGDRMNAAVGSRGRPSSGRREFGRYSSSRQATNPSRKNDAVGNSRSEAAVTTTKTNDDNSFQSSQPLLTPLPPRNLNDALQRTDEKQQQPQHRLGDSQSSKDTPKSTPRRDKRARIQLPHLVMRPPSQQKQVPASQLHRALSTRHPFQTLSHRRTIATVATSTLAHSMRTPSSFVARGAHAVRSVAASAMTPLRTFRFGQPSVANAARITPRHQVGYAAPSSAAATENLEEQQPSPLERSARTRFEEKNATGLFWEKKDDDESVVECSVPIKHTNQIHQFQLSQSSNCQDATVENDDDDDVNTKTSASTYDPNKTIMLKTNDEINFQHKADDVVGWIESTKKEMEATKKEIEQQRQFLDARHREIIEAQELLARQRGEISEMIKGQEAIAQLIERAKKDIEGKALEANQTMERSSNEFKSLSQSQRECLCQLANESKKDIETRIKRLVDDSEVNIQVCGKLEVEALEKESRAIHTKLLQFVEGATGDLGSERQRSIETLLAESRSAEEDIRQMIKGVIAAAKSDFELWVTEVADKENTKPSGHEASCRSPLKNSEGPILKALVSTVTRSDNSTKDTPAAEDNSVDDDSSLLNNSSISPTPVSRRTPIALTNTVKEIASNFSTHSELRPGISLSTPFSRKATPRIENSYSKLKRVSLRDGDHSSHKMKSSNPSLPNIDPPKDSTTDVNLKESVSTTPAAIHLKKCANRSTKLKSPVRTAKKRTLPTTKNPSPRRSKRLREFARAAKKIEVEHNPVLGEPSQDYSLVKPEVAPRDIIDCPNGESVSSTSDDDARDMIVGTVVDTSGMQDLNLDLDGCESIVQGDIGPLATPWGIRNAAKTRKTKTYTAGRRRDRKPFSFEALSNIFEFRF